MDTIISTAQNNKTFDPHRLLLNLSDQMSAYAILVYQIFKITLSI